MNAEQFKSIEQSVLTSLDSIVGVEGLSESDPCFPEFQAGLQRVNSLREALRQGTVMRETLPELKDFPCPSQSVTIDDFEFRKWLILRAAEEIAQLIKAISDLETALGVELNQANPVHSSPLSALSVASMKLLGNRMGLVAYLAERMNELLAAFKELEEAKK